jgi:exodeoxyribonuclease VII small subunit
VSTKKKTTPKPTPKPKAEARAESQTEPQAIEPGELDAAIADLSYEDAIERLESLIDRIESGEIGLEESIAAYEEGVKLRQHCAAILAKAEQRVAHLTPEAVERAAAGDEADAD